MPTPTAAQLESLRHCDTCSVANAIEGFNVRLRNEGFTNGEVHCLIPRPERMVGYAVTARMKSSNPPPAEGRIFTDRTDWWTYLQSLPTPRILVIEDMDEVPCTSSLAGSTHAHVWMALGCIGLVTNGAVRDLPAMEKTSLHVYANALVPSHGFAHIVEFGKPVTLGGLEISSGDLLHGDVHGIVNVPKELVEKIPAAAAAALERERQLQELCRSKDFSIETLRQMVKQQS